MRGFTVFVTFLQSLMNTVKIKYVKFETLRVCLQNITVHNHHRAHKFINHFQLIKAMSMKVASKKLSKKLDAYFILPFRS